MRAAVLAVGSELLGSDRVDTNSLVLAEALGRHGIELATKSIVGDEIDQLVAEVRRLTASFPLVVITGGLGPTRDDLTREAVAAAFDLSLERRQELIHELEEKFARFGIRMAKNNERQADVPTGATVHSNPRGTAPGLELTAGGATLFLFPGVPTELEGLIETALEPWLERKSAESDALAPRQTEVLRTACLPESTLEEMLDPFYEEFGRGGLSVLPSPGEVVLHLTASGSAAERRAWLEERIKCLRGLLGDYLYAEGAGASLEGTVGELLLKHDSTVAVAESCTGGLIAERLTRIAGSSRYFLGGVVTYSNELKRDLLGVSEESLERWGAVSEGVVLEMAAGARQRLQADFALAVSGIAGPGGGTDEKPVGTVHLGVEGPRGQGHRKLVLPGDRGRVRRLASQWALDVLRRELLAETQA